MKAQSIWRKTEADHRSMTAFRFVAFESRNAIRIRATYDLGGKERALTCSWRRTYHAGLKTCHWGFSSSSDQKKALVSVRMEPWQQLSSMKTNRNESKSGKLMKCPKIEMFNQKNSFRIGINVIIFFPLPTRIHPITNFRVKYLPISSKYVSRNFSRFLISKIQFKRCLVTILDINPHHPQIIALYWVHNWNHFLLHLHLFIFLLKK